MKKLMLAALFVVSGCAWNDYSGPIPATGKPMTNASVKSALDCDRSHGNCARNDPRIHTRPSSARSY